MMFEQFDCSLDVAYYILILTFEKYLHKRKF